MSQTAFETLDLSEEIEFASKLAREAATIVNTFYVGSSEVRYKSENEPVTEADRSANQHIVTRIQAAYPDDGILSEESKDNLIRLERDRVWIIDPLDGTKEFIARNGEFSIMIGLAIHGKAVMGVIMQPDPGLLYVGAVNHGAFLHEEGESIPLAVSDKSSINQMIMVSSRSHRQQIVDKVRKELHITSERVSGSVGLKVGLISRQLADLYIHPSPGCKEWDICAPAALLEAAGGTITDCWGEPIVFNKRDVRAHNGLMATNGQTHEKVVEVVARICEEFGFNQDDGFW
ncbi:MAG: 3'(2'),5'-bisphosphate nucleotidase CysQ [Caldilineaceae bacterium]|nr:3'(2'),5'-bisphosphate nucleotidase CysQ [Caldilineaceae bacterium]MCB0122384.1 3'(2'),5'-bisphosphate nucleotidase CysQ [Caldilineaceae bacterium]MCB0187906.1 3'(2'),5'-bisphosphate nucleotidase CysQ [Caldilineaceae bacterium]HRW06144.1 3'(2'),5'-bisphosphate nucleotidase CysQ [Caldilineaceae bacterium]